MLFNYDPTKEGGLREKISWFDAFKKKAFEVSEDVEGIFTAIKQDISEGFLLEDIIPNLNADENLKEFLEYAQKTEGIDLNVEAYKNWATEVKGLGKTFDIAKTKAIAFNSVVIQLGAKLIDNWIHQVDNAKEALEEAADAYENVQNELSDITSELEDQQKALDDLLAKDKLTYTEQGELEELQKITEELRTQKDLVEKKEALAQKDVAEKASDLFNKQFGDYDISANSVDEYRKTAGITQNNAILMSDENNISSMIAAYQQFNELLDEARASTDPYEIEHFLALTSDLYDSLFNTASELQNQKTNILDYYNTIKDSPYDELTSKQKQVIDSYNSISAAIALIYKMLEPSQWNSMQIDQIFSTENIEKSKEELIQMAKEGTLNEDTINSYDKLNSVLEESDLVLEDGQSAANAFVNEIYAMAKSLNSLEGATNSLTSLNSKFESLNNTGMVSSFQMLKSVMDEIADEGKASYSTIGEISDRFKDAVPNIEKYIDVLLDSSSTASEARNAITSLTQEYINNKIASGQLADADEKMVASMLDEVGIANSTAIAHEMITRARTRAAEEAYKNGEITYEEAQALINESLSADMATQALAQLELAKYAVNDTAIDTTDDVDNIINLAKAAGASASALSILATAKEALESGDGQQLRWAREQLEKISSGTFDFGFNVDNQTTYKGTIPEFKPSSENDNSADQIDDLRDKIADYQEQLEELAETEALEKLKHKFDMLEQSIEEVDNAISLLDTSLNLQAEDDYVGKLETVTRQLDLAQQKSVLLKDEFAQLSAEEYSTGDMANELATRMKSVADSMAENSQDILSYGKSITEYYMSAMTSISSLSKDTIDEATNLFERNVKTLQEGGLTGLQFTLSPTVPQSAYEKQRSENQKLEDEMRSYYDTVAAMQKTALDMQYQETVESNEKQRQELLQSIAEAEQEIQGYSNQIQTIQKTTNANTSAAQKTDDANKLSEEKSFISSMEDNITELNTWMENNPIKAPELDSGWKQLVTDAQNYAQQIKDAFNGSFGEGRDALVAAARSQLGSGYKQDYAVNGGINPTAWCNDFVSWAAKQAGLDSVIPMGSYTPDTASRFGSNLKSASSGYIPKFGDIAYYSTNGSMSGIYHVEIVTAVNPDGTVTTIGGNTGGTAGNRVVSERVRNDKPAFYGTYAKGTLDSIAGENYKPEYLINKKTGDSYRVDGPTLFSIKECDVIGEDLTAKIEKNKYANGTLSGYSNLGNLDVVTELPKLSVEQIETLIEKHFSKSGSVVKSSDAQGIYAAQNTTGISALAILGIGALESGWGTSNIAKAKGNLWGYGAVDSNPMGGAHTYGSSVGDAAQQYASELLKDFYNGYNEKSISAMSNNYASNKSWGTNVSSIMNTLKNTLVDSGLDKIENISTYTQQTAANTASTASNVSTIAKVDFKTELRNLLNGDKDTVAVEGWQGDLIDYIKESISSNADANEKFIEKWDRLQEYQNEQTELFKTYDEQLLAAVGTDGFVALRDEIAQATNDYTTAITGLSSEVALEQIKSEFSRAKEMLNAILAYYNKRKAEGASADELSTIIEAYNTQSETVNDLSDQYVSQMQSYTDYLTSLASRDMQSYTDRLSWIEKENEELERQYNLTSDTAEQTAIASQRIDNYNKQIDLLTEKQAAAHQGVLDLYNNEDYAPVFERFDIESWFDANGESTAKFAEDIERMGLSEETSYLVPIMQQIFEQIQEFKKAYYDAGDKINDIKDSIKDIEDNQKLEKVEVWEQFENRLSEILDYQKALNDAVTTAKQSMYDLYDSLREEENSITAELRANKHLGEWLSEDTRKQLFNDDDYAAEMKVINEIRSEMEDLYSDYYNQISNLTEEEAWKETAITAEYNKQVEALQDKLSIAKQSLQVAKDEAAFENALKERDTQIIRGNRVQNVADPDNLYNLAQTMTQSQLELENQKTQSDEAEDIRNMERISDSLANEQAAIQNRLDMYNAMTEEEQLIFADFLEPVEALTAKLNGIVMQDPWYMISEDNTNDLYNNLDKTKYRGYNLAYDNEAGAEMLSQLIGMGYITKEQGQKAIENLYANHDNKTLTDSHNLGYPVHNPDSEILQGRSALKMYDDLAITEALKSAGVDDNTITEALSAVAERISTYLANGTVVSGEGDYVFSNATTHKLNDTTVSGDGTILADGNTAIETGATVITGDGEVLLDLSGYKVVPWEDLGGGLDIANFAMDPTPSATDTLSRYNGFDNEAASAVIKNIGTEDNSTNIHVNQMTFTNPVGTADDIFSSVIQKTSSMASITNNQH